MSVVVPNVPFNITTKQFNLGLRSPQHFSPHASGRPESSACMVHPGSDVSFHYKTPPFSTFM